MQKLSDVTMSLDWSPSNVYLVETTLRHHMSMYGYEMIDLPMIEVADLFLTRAGDEIIGNLFTFDRRQTLLALRPEFTASAIQRYVQEDKTQPVRWQFSGAIFIDEPQDNSHNYQKWSVGAELIGIQGIMADTEIILMALEGVKKTGLSDWKLVIGNAGIQQYLLNQHFQLDARTRRLILQNRHTLRNSKAGKEHLVNQLKQMLPFGQSLTDPNVVQDTHDHTGFTLDTLLDATHYGATLGGRTRYDIAERLLEKRQRSIALPAVLEAIDFLEQWVNIRGSISEAFPAIAQLVGTDDEYAQAMLESWRMMIDLLVQGGIPEDHIVIEPDLARNWEYYTGVVFGIQATDGHYVGGGGRYDALTRLVGSEAEVPAIGFAYYIDNLLEALPKLTAPPPFQINIHIHEHFYEETMQLARIIRERGIVAILVEEDNIGENTVSIQAPNECSFQGRTYSLDEFVEVIENTKVHKYD